jgi:hypothetical protein
VRVLQSVLIRYGKKFKVNLVEGFRRRFVAVFMM